MTSRPALLQTTDRIQVRQKPLVRVGPRLAVRRDQQAHGVDTGRIGRLDLAPQFTCAGGDVAFVQAHNRSGCGVGDEDRQPIRRPWAEVARFWRTGYWHRVAVAESIERQTTRR